MAKYCKNCGSELDEGSMFCNECGAKASGTGYGNNFSIDVFKKYNIDMMDGEYVIRQSQIHEGCLIAPSIVLGIGILLGIINLFLQSIIIFLILDC